MSYDENDKNIEYEIIDPSISEHKSDVISSIIYGPTSRKESKRLQKRELFYAWVKGLNPNKDVKTETHNFTYTRYTVDSKGKRETEQQQEQQQQLVIV